MLKLSGLLINFLDKSEFKKDGELATPVKAKLQILVDEKRANGSITKVLHTISIPDEKIVLYKDKVSKEISVDVAIISKQFGFYGV